MSRKEPRHEARLSTGKTPRAIPPGSSGKVPRDQAGPSFLNLRPSWRVGSLELVDNTLGWHQLDSTALRRVRERLAAFETMSWADILVQAKKQNHSIPLDSLSMAARKNLEDRRLLLDEVVSLRLSGAERIFGYLEQGVFVALWWDPRHQVCPSAKKHT